MFLQPINIRNAPTSRRADAKIKAGIMAGDPIIPAIDNPEKIKAPNRKTGIPTMKQITATIIPTAVWLS
jgi:hypothetical protein